MLSSFSELKTVWLVVVEFHKVLSGNGPDKPIFRDVQGLDRTGKKNILGTGPDQTYEAYMNMEDI